MMTLPANCYGLWFRMVTEEDAEFILSLRTNAVLAKHLSVTNDNLELQRSWIRAYKKREAVGQEFYVLFENEGHEPQGVIRLYNISEQSYTCGSWIIKRGADESIAFRSDLFISDFASELGLSGCIFDVRKDNKRTLRFHKRFARITGEDDLNYYFEISPEGLNRKRDFLQRLLE